MKIYLFKTFYIIALGFSCLLLQILMSFELDALNILMLQFYHPNKTAFIERYQARCGFFFKCSVDKKWQPLSQISKHLQNAVVIAEDNLFYQHPGIDTKSIQKSWEYNQKKKKIKRGASTLTQQLVKNLYLSPNKNYYRKLKEIILALWMETILSKERILELYLNNIEWGKGIYGAEAASQHYFNISAMALNTQQAAYLAAIIPNPQLYTSKLSHRALRRQQLILNRLGR